MSMSTENQLGPENNDICHSIKKKTILQDTTSTTSSQTYEIGNKHISTCSEMHRNILNGPQMAVHSILKKTNYGPQSWTGTAPGQHQ